MKAIVTRYVGPTNTKGSRIIANAEGVPSIQVSYDDALNSEENHAAAARKLAAKYDWKGRLIAGGMPDGASVCHVFDGGTLLHLQSVLAMLQDGRGSGNPYCKNEVKAALNHVGSITGEGDWNGANAAFRAAQEAAQ